VEYHKHPAVQARLAKHPRVHTHMGLTLTSGSWLNLVEIFFGIITRQAIRRGTLTSVKDLIAAIETFIDGWNDRRPDEILTKANRLFVIQSALTSECRAPLCRSDRQR
jgi:hypothetical protein